MVRIVGVLTLAERQLGKSLSPEKGRDLIKQVRKQLLELARPMLESLVHEVTGVKVVSMHHDISTVTGEEVVVFSLVECASLRVNECQKKQVSSLTGRLADAGEFRRLLGGIAYDVGLIGPESFCRFASSQDIKRFWPID